MARDELLYWIFDLRYGTLEEPEDRASASVADPLEENSSGSTLTSDALQATASTDGTESDDEVQEVPVEPRHFELLDLTLDDSDGPHDPHSTRNDISSSTDVRKSATRIEHECFSVDDEVSCINGPTIPQEVLDDSIAVNRIYGTTHKYLGKNFSVLKKINPSLAKRVLCHYNHPQNKTKLKVHLCGLSLIGICDYFNYRGSFVNEHISSNHPGEMVPVMKISGYPENRV